MAAKKQTPLPGFLRKLQPTVVRDAAVIRTAAVDDLKFMLSRAKIWSNELGFIPASGMETLVKEGRGLVLEVNGERAGYILTSGGLRKPMVIRHNTVDVDLWNGGFGRDLVKAVLDWSLWTGRHTVLCRTRRDLVRQRSINATLGGYVLGSDDSIGKRGEPVDVWSLSRVPTLFRSEPLAAS